MGKRSKRRPLRYEEDQLGCMSGLSSIFYFRRGGFAERLILDKRRGSRHSAGTESFRSKIKLLTDFENGQGIDDRNENMHQKVGKPSVETLVEEDMTSEPESKPKQEISSMKLEKNKSQSGSLFGRKSNCSRRKLLSENESSQASTRIVILKPDESTGFQDGVSDKSFSHFSLTEVKRKLTRAIEKKRSVIPPNLVDGEKGVGVESIAISPSKNLHYTERFPNISTSPKNVDKARNRIRGDCEDVEPETDNSSGKIVANIYIETKRHLSEMLENGYELEEDNSSEHVPKTLGRILSLPLFETAPCIYDEVEGTNTNPDILDDLINDVEVEETVLLTINETGSEGDLEVIRTVDIDEDDIFLTKKSQPGDTSELCARAILNVFEASPPQLSSPLASPPSSPTASKLEHREHEIDRTDGQSPIYVLEPLFSDDDISPTSIVSLPPELPINPPQIQFQENENSSRDQGFLKKTCMKEDLESIIEYCETVLQASGIFHDELRVKSLSSDGQFLDLSLLDEIVFFPNALCHDQKLIFDCLNEVLADICDYYFGFLPWVSFVNLNIRPAPNNIENTMVEVCEGVERCLAPHLSPRTLDQIVSKDFARNGKWMELRFDTESIGAEISDFILDELIMEDMILSLYFS